MKKTKSNKSDTIAKSSKTRESNKAHQSDKTNKPKKPKQISLFKKIRKNTKKWWIENQAVYGGSISYRKTSRPFDSKKLMHTVFKANLGKGIWFTRSQHSITKLLIKAAYRYNIKVKSFSIQKDHIHLLTYPNSSRSPILAAEDFKNFLRFFPAEMGRKYKIIFENFGVTKSSTGKNDQVTSNMMDRQAEGSKDQINQAVSKPKSFWAHRPFTRVVSWGKKSVQAVVNYLKKNDLEALGFLEYTPRNHRLNEFLKKWSFMRSFNPLETG